MDKLTPPQLVLLNILVAFVVSIATTIISIALLADTPLSITQVTNTITERERLVDAQTEQLKEEILAELSVVQPQVAGVQDEYEITPLDITEQVNGWYEAPYLALADDLYVTTQEGDHTALFDGDGVYEITVGEIALLHDVGFVETSFIGGMLGQDVSVYNPATDVFLRGYVSQVDVAGEVRDGDYLVSYVDVSNCAPGAMVIDAAGLVVGVCINDTSALQRITRVMITNPNEVEAS